MLLKGISRSDIASRWYAFKRFVPSISNKTKYYLNDLWSLDLKTLKWKCLSTDPNSSASTTGRQRKGRMLPHPKRRKECAIWLDTQSNELYIHGGQGEEARLNDLWKFSLDNKEWVHIQPKNKKHIPIARYGHCGVYQNGYGYIWGGKRLYIK